MAVLLLCLRPSLPHTEFMVEQFEDVVRYGVSDVKNLAIIVSISLLSHFFVVTIKDSLLT